MEETEHRTYLAIDLKSFYASVECSDLDMDALSTHLVVADASRTEKTICLAVSPSLKKYGIPGRARLFEVVQAVKLINNERRKHAPGHVFTGASSDAKELANNPSLEMKVEVIVPHMSRYMEVSNQIYQVYLKYVSAKDIHVYSIDEVFIDVTDYLPYYRKTARQLCMDMIQDVLESTGITATAGIGTNLYLAKVAMDIVAKHAEADGHGVRMAELDEISYREQLWTHKPLTDFWRIGSGTAKKLQAYGMETMGDVALCSVGDDKHVWNAKLLYKLFGINAELIIDHAWGYESATIEQIQAYVPQNSSLSEGQVLMSPYTFEKARLIVHEMADQLSLNLVSKGLMTSQLVLHISYDVESLKNPEIASRYTGKTGMDYYGRKTPVPAHGSVNIGRYTSASSLIDAAALELYDRIVNPLLLVRRVNISCNTLTEAEAAELAEASTPQFEQLDLFGDAAAKEAERAEEEAMQEKLTKERKLQDAVLALKGKYGKNAVLKGMNFEEGGTTRQRNNQIGGHKA